MNLSRRTLLGSAALAATSAIRPARAQRPVIRLGVLNDQSGPYADDAGSMSVLCARQAVQEFGDHGFHIEGLVGDHQNKPDVRAGTAPQWPDHPVPPLLHPPTPSAG